MFSWCEWGISHLETWVFGQDGWILAKFCFCVFMDRDGDEVHKHAKKEVWGQDGCVYWASSFFAFMDRFLSVHKLAKKERGQYFYSHLDRTNLVNKGFIIWLSGKSFLRDTAGSPKRARWSHLAHSGSQSKCAIWLILPAHGASDIITLIIFLTIVVNIQKLCMIFIVNV